nr:hypothetical protein [Acidipropionibacterium acidipropionici]
MREATSTSAGFPGSAGRAGVKLRVNPSLASGSISRRARVVMPWARRRWWVAVNASQGSAWPGACWPVPWPSTAEHQGSLTVVQVRTLSPSTPWTATA